VTCDDASISVTANQDGSYTANLPNTTKTYTFTATYTDSASLNTSAVCTVTVTAQSSGGNSSGSGGGGSSSSSSSKPTTVTNDDGSKTTTVTDRKTGVVTATTKWPDGSLEVVETKKDGTITATTQKPNGFTEVIETKKDGTVTTTDTALSGVVVKTVSQPKKDTTVSVTIPAHVAEAAVSVPATVLDYTTVAIHAVTGELIKLAVPNEGLDKMQMKLDCSADLILVQRPNHFQDTQSHWAQNAIDFTAAHALFQGTSDTDFSPDMEMSRAMMVTILARLDGVDTSGAATWYEKGAQWAKKNNISDSANLDAIVTREQLATMLWRYSGCPIAAGELTGFSDSENVSDFARVSMRWAVKQGLFVGLDDGTLAPQGSATRAQVSEIMLRFYRYMVQG